MKDFRKLIDAISINRLVQAINALHWREDEPIIGGRVRQFISPDGEDAVLLPVDKNFTDYYQVMYSTISSLAESNGRSVESMINRLINPAYDILKWRLADLNGSIPLTDMADTLDRIKGLLAVSCLDTLTPAKYHNKIFTRHVNKTISEYSIGQTEYGSYILNILCPLGNYQFELFEQNYENLPLNRKINLKLMSALKEIQSSIDRGDRNRVEEKVHEGVYSVNFLDALSGIYEEYKDHDINIVADWCKEIAIPEDLDSDIILKADYLEPVKYIADKYRPKREDNVRKEYIGRINTLKAKPELNDREDIVVSIATIGDDGKSLIVHAKLNNELYGAVATTAFETGAFVRISGILKTTATTYNIVDGELQMIQ